MYPEGGHPYFDLSRPKHREPHSFFRETMYFFYEALEAERLASIEEANFKK
jgi:hypothetical protein